MFQGSVYVDTGGHWYMGTSNGLVRLKDGLMFDTLSTKDMAKVERCDVFRSPGHCVKCEGYRDAIGERDKEIEGIKAEYISDIDALTKARDGWESVAHSMTDDRDGMESTLKAMTADRDLWKSLCNSTGMNEAVVNLKNECERWEGFGRQQVESITRLGNEKVHLTSERDHLKVALEGMTNGCVDFQARLRDMTTERDRIKAMLDTGVDMVNPELIIKERDEAKDKVAELVRQVNRERHQHTSKLLAVCGERDKALEEPERLRDISDGQAKVIDSLSSAIRQYTRLISSSVNRE